MAHTYGLKAIPKLFKNNISIVAICIFKFWNVCLNILFCYIVLQFSYGLNKGKLTEDIRNFSVVKHQEISNSKFPTPNSGPLQFSELLVKT